MELTGGGSSLLRAAGQRLRDAGLRQAAYSAKLERALAVDIPAPDAGSRPPGDEDRLGPGSPSGEVVKSYLGEQAARLAALDTAVRRAEPDSIHQMRVTARRLRSTLQAFAVIWPSPATGHLKDELKWLGRVLGDARDLEVLSEYFQAELAGTPAELVLGPAKARITVYFAPREAAGARSRAPAGGPGGGCDGRDGHRPARGARSHCTRRGRRPNARGTRQRPWYRYPASGRGASPSG